LLLLLASSSNSGTQGGSVKQYDNGCVATECGQLEVYTRSKAAYHVLM
jgi:hypothetical protein